KYIDIYYHFTCKAIDKGYITLVYYPTNKIVANIFTKALLHLKIEKMVILLGLYAV
ncbi:hypothetical protein HETIRDRAFT_305813, partial [Heterobasidion irregulare TC 32-1]